MTVNSAELEAATGDDKARQESSEIDVNSLQNKTSMSSTRANAGVQMSETKAYKQFDTSGVTAQYVTKEVLLGMTIGFAQIPESVAFAYMAHIRPPIALHAAWMVGLFCSLLGGRPGMVNGATGAFAAIISTFLPKPDVVGGNGAGIELLFPSVMVAGVFMLIVSVTKLSRFILLLPSPVMIGFCNGLAIVIGLAQLHPFKDTKTHEWRTGMELFWMLLITIVAMLTMEYMPKVPLKIGKIKVFEVIPSSLLAIISSIVIQYGIVIPSGGYTDTIGDVSEFTSETALPIPFFVDHVSTNYNLSLITAEGATQKILLQGFLLALVGSIESLMTSEVVESYVKTPSNGDRTVAAMGLGNILSGFFGGMGGNAMIGLSTINSLNGGKGRLAPTTTALVVLIATVGAYPALNVIPVSALAGIMLVVVLHTFKWFSVPMVLASFMPQRMRIGLTESKFNFLKMDFRRKIPRTEAAVIVLVTLMSIYLNIAYAVCAGAAVCALMFSWSAAGEFAVDEMFVGETKVYKINGPLYFATSNRLVKMLDPVMDPNTVEVHLGQSCVLDYSGMECMNKLTSKYKAADKTISFHQVTTTGQRLINKSAGLCMQLNYTKSDAMDVSQAGKTSI
eukprot:TRINITY_DN19194_c0_g2_i1.p1 TRINITY_DN19194_c0_g2~~TRINITY_DN19194_c0_g2_i1.p1  ORF type:complete len:637 (-),score=98.71 TRINITY_DN19194_c0_g2_i1:257-2116(-)